ncbi:MAG TPA: DUF4340 domain-containing protein, partial [Candidatus Eremiobacteraeota bacterium]|nr:DUF4340 domain-containing protein [Candidatus Eremiobacteraeota bacterium]
MFKFKGTLVLVVLVVILLAYVLLIEIKKPTGDEKKEQEKIIMKIEDTDKIKSLKFKQKNSEIICEKQNNEWFITSPVKARGDEGMFNGCLANFTELKADEKLTEGLENLSSYGLDNPYCVVTITFEDGTNRVLSIGKKTFNDNSYYARLGEENQIFTIGSYIVDGHFVRSLIDLRDKTVLACSSSDVREFEFKTGERTVKCQKDSKNRWSILSPFNYRADSVQIDTWINTLNSARAKEFIKEESTSTDLAIYGLDKPFMDVTVLSGKDKAKKTLFIGKKATDG